MAATPPPLHPRQDNNSRPTPPPPASPQRPVLPSSSGKRISTPLIVGICIAGAALIAALVLWLLSSRQTGDPYSSGDNDADKEWLHDSDSVAVVAPVDTVAIVSRTPIAGQGFNDKMPFYLSLDFDGDIVSGRFTNVIYGLQFPVRGNVNGSAYDLTIGTGSEESRMLIHDVGDAQFTGTWGKNDSPVTAYLCENASPSAPSTYSMSYRYEGKFSGGGVSHDVVLLFSSDYDSGLMYYPRIGMEYAMNFMITGSESYAYTLYAYGRNVATLHLNIYDDFVEGTMNDAMGREFSLNLSAPPSSKPL